MTGIVESGEPSLQERFFPTMACFGCGPVNPRGLRLASFPARDGSTATVATFRPWPEHDNGLGYLNGGIICTLLDCHSATPMVIEADRLGLLSADIALPYVTSGLDVRYLRPSPLTEPVDLRASLVDASEDVITVEVELRWEGKTRAAATAIWRRWRPRA
ncbi:MAG: PaaI family thioesterase [Candidatus Nanopelagicales bacterium]